MIGKELNLPNKAFCTHCHDYRKVFYGKRIAYITYRDAYIEYEEIMGFCTKCGDHVQPPGVWDENLNRVQEEYKSTYGDAVSAFLIKKE